jgi:hypothetical protein
VENLSTNHARLGKVEYPLVRSKLRAWLVLEDFYSKIIEAAEKGNREEFVSSFYSYVSTAFSIPAEELQSCPWYEVTRAFREIYLINIPSLDFPILRRKMEEKGKNKKIEWEYPGRTWYIWLHLISKEYGWDINYIENMLPDDGIALLQEILLDDQLDKEWEWSLTELAYSYDANTKTSKFIPLERPEWMRPNKVAKVEKVKVRASELPIGIVLKWDTDTNEYTRPQ